MSARFVTPHFEVLRKQLATSADHISAAIAEASHRPSRERLSQLAIQLGGVARLAMQLHAAMSAESQGGPPDAA